LGQEKVGRKKKKDRGGGIFFLRVEINQIRVFFFFFFFFIFFVHIQTMSNEKDSGEKRRVAVIGATGQIGRPTSLALLRNGHAVLAVSRSRDSRGLAELEAAGASVAVVADLAAENGAGIENALREWRADTVIMATRASVDFVRSVEPVVIAAAERAGCVRRFLPNEFGAHTRAMDRGVGALFDAKKDVHEVIERSPLEYTLFYNGGIFEYFVYSLVTWDEITTFGNLDAPLYTHDINDIGELVARAAVDPRTANKCVQMDGNPTTQRKMLETLRRNFPDEPRVTAEPKHYSSEDILRLRDEAAKDPAKISAKMGSESDLERWGINNAVYVKGQLAAPGGPNTLRSTFLWPEFVYRKPEEVLADRKFVLGEE
jgi:uncharacterized protein YbjT (DUF2867 family)